MLYACWCTNSGSAGSARGSCTSSRRSAAPRARSRRLSIWCSTSRSTRSSGCWSPSRLRSRARHSPGEDPMQPRRRRACAGAIWLTLAAVVSSAACLEAFAQTIVHTEKSLYRNITVIDDDGLRCMKFSRNYVGGRQSCMLLRDPDRLVLDYTQMMLASLYVVPAPKRILIVGLGGGTLPKALARLLPDSNIDVVEVDAAVIGVASKFFAFAPGAHVRVTEEDG